MTSLGSLGVRLPHGNRHHLKHLKGHLAAAWLKARNWHIRALGHAYGNHHICCIDVTAAGL